MNFKMRKEENEHPLRKKVLKATSFLKDSFSGEKIKSRILPALLRKTVLGIASFLLSGAPMLFGCIPMGLSLLCAAETDLFPIWIGCVLGALWIKKELALFLTVYTLIFAVKLHLYYRQREKATEDPLSSGTPKVLKIALALASSLSLGLYGCFAEQFTLHAFFALLFYLLSSGTFTFLLSSLFSKNTFGSFFGKIGLITLAFMTVFASDSFSFFGFSAAPVLGTLLLLLFCRGEHPLFCAFAGAILGLACGRNYAPILALTGVADAALWRISKRTAPWLSVLVGFAWAFYAEGSRSLLYVLPDMVCALMLYVPLNSYLEKRKSEDAVKQSPLPKEEDSLEESLQGLSEKLSGLSSVLRLPQREHTEHLCRQSVQKVCNRCGGNCFSSSAALSSLSETLFETGRLIFEKPPQALSSGCMHYRELCDGVNESYALYLEALSAKDPAACYASCYKGIAQLMEDRKQTARQEEEEDEKSTELFSSALDRLKIGYEAASVTGKRELLLKASGVSISDLSKGASDLRSHFERACGIKLSLPRLVLTEKERSLLFYRRTALSATFGSARTKKSGEDYCGDTLCSFEKKGYRYFLLCDGMGSGREAALCSGIACYFIEQLSSCGGSLETVLKTVNEFLLSQKCECSTTVDLMRLDLYDGQCIFIKSGACPSIVLRGGNLFKVCSASMPIGAVREPNCEQISLQLKAGDRVIMASDGVAADIEGSVWLKELLAGRLKSDSQGLAEDILSLCKEADPHPDDRSVMVIDLFGTDEPSK
ncbi:MAG: SpoIIE family protein phosphatase [Clostridia bacterium]|nr:SpoIIE family protein phosphatase [Clostridia bacterium]